MRTQGGEDEKRMRIETLGPVVQAARLGSISAAARACNLSQTTLSSAVAALERELGIRIFERGTDGVALTEEGRTFVDLAQAMLGTYGRMRALSQGSADKVRIVVNRMIYSFFCADVMPQVHERFPELTVAVEAAQEGSLARQQLAGDQLGIGCCPVSALRTERIAARRRGLEITELFASEFMAYVSADNPLAMQSSLLADKAVLSGQKVVVDACCRDLFFESGLDQIVKSHSVLDQVHPTRLIAFAAQPDTVAFTVNPVLLPGAAKKLDGVVALPLAEPEGWTRRFTTHYLVVRDPMHATVTDRNVAACLVELLGSGCQRNGATGRFSV